MMITVVLILVGIAATRYEKSVLRAREATLMQDCFVMRNAIQQYTLDKHTAPTSMDDLVRAEYLAAAPIDPITHEKLSVPDCVAGPENYMDPVQTIPGVRRLYSYSTGTSRDGAHSNE
jgi:type II secretory pathway pseudopilin PulG